MTVASAVGQVQENSPAQQAGLEPYFDFIITIGHSRLVRLPPCYGCLVCVCVCVSCPTAGPTLLLPPFPSGGRPSPSLLLLGLYSA